MYSQESAKPHQIEALNRIYNRGRVALKFIDTHCHIIPEVDDGPPDTATSVEMARIAVADGISTIFVTPHIIEGYYDGSDLGQRLQALTAVLAENDISLNLISGAEVPMSACNEGNRDVLSGLTLGKGSFLLIETADTTIDQIASAAYQVRLCGLYPVLAHPERSAFVRNNLGRLEEILGNKDVFCQITAASIEGLFGSDVQRTCYSMLAAGMVHLVATDAHSTGRRKPVLSESYRLLKKTAGIEVADKVMYENPKRVLDGDILLQPSVMSGRVSNKNFLARLFRK